jgi:hypothetical protein
VVLLDPPADAERLALIGELEQAARVHVVWGEAELSFARSVAEANEPLRPALAIVWRAARDGVTPLLAAGTIAACTRVLEELGLDPGQPPAGKVDLERSATFRDAQERCRRSLDFLSQLASGDLPLPEPMAVAAAG